MTLILSFVMHSDLGLSPLDLKMAPRVTRDIWNLCTKFQIYRLPFLAMT